MAMHVQSTPGTSRFTAALFAGGVAIVLNTVALDVADLFHLETAHGGLLRMLSSWLAVPFDRLGVTAVWSYLDGPSPTGPVFRTGFHLFVGLLMAQAYAFVLERRLPGSIPTKGLIYAAIVWIINATVVLPATGEGFAGRAHLTFAGIAWFAVCHTLFFLVLAYDFAALMSQRAPGADPVGRRTITATDQGVRRQAGDDRKQPC